MGVVHLEMHSKLQTPTHHTIHHKYLCPLRVFIREHKERQYAQKSLHRATHFIYSKRSKQSTNMKDGPSTYQLLEKNIQSYLSPFIVLDLYSD